MPKRLGRRAFLGTLAAGAASFGLVRAEETTARRKPNVLYLFSDEHRYQSMSCTEMPELKTPNMARLAKDGVSFTHCISNYPVCSPHRAILMTGRWPFQQGVIDNGIDLNPNEMTLGKAFKAAGYKTGYIGKWHLGGTRAEPFGFDESLIWTGDNVHWDKAQYHPKEGGPIQPKGYNATLMTDQALAFIEENADKDEPFFLMVSWNPPHSNFIDAPEDKKALYPEGSLPFRPNYESDKTDPEARKIWDDNGWPEYQGYHAHITAIDQELGRILAKLDEIGIAGGTIVVYSADHGSMFGSHGVGSKRQPFDESIRVPFLVRGPGIAPAGRTCGNLFGTINVMPTLCGLAEIPIPDSCMGQDFSRLIRSGGQDPDPESQFIMHISKENASHGNEHPAPLFRGVRTKRYTYAVYPDRPWCLFDNDEDPYQMHNLIDDPGYADTRKKLDAMLRDWLKKAGDPFEMPAEAAHSVNST